MSEYGIYHGKDVLSQAAEVKPIIEQLLWEKDTIVLLGKEKTGKSIFCLQMACCLTTGEPLLDTFPICTPRTVLYIQVEGKRYETQQRLKNMMLGTACDLDRFIHIYYKGMALDTNEGYDHLNSWVDETCKEIKLKPDVIIIDPLYMSIQGDLSDAKSSQAWIKNVRGFADHHDAALIVVHHAHRPFRTREGDVVNEGDDSIYGSFVWKAFADHILLLSKKKSNYTLSCSTQRSSNVIPTIEFKLLSPSPLLFVVEDGDATTRSIAVHNILMDNPLGLSAEQLITMTNYGRATIYRSLRVLQSGGVVQKIDKSRPILYQVVRPT